MDTKRWTLFITGTVQGVYYRASTEAKAQDLGLTGYARNLPDGRVEVVAEGTQAQLTELKDWCHQGPPAARVSAVNVTEQAPTGKFRSFSVRP